MIKESNTQYLIIKLINRKELETTINTLNKIKENIEEELNKGITKKNNCTDVLEYSLLEKLLKMKRYKK